MSFAINRSNNSLLSISKDEIRCVECGIIYRSLVEDIGRERHMSGFELEKHERLQGLGIDNSIASFVDACTNYNWHFHSYKRLRIAILLYEGSQERLPHGLFGRCGNVFPTKRAEQLLHVVTSNNCL